jgi:phage terminase large subunit GpA-like protein
MASLHNKQLSAEQRFIDRTRSGKVVRWRKTYIRNEVLDARVYALGALYVLFDDARSEWRVEHGKDQEYGWTQFWNEAEALYGRHPGELPENEEGGEK